MIDPVTKLPDRWEFKKRIGIETNRAIRHGYSVAIFLMDLDDFSSKISNLREEERNSLIFQISEALRANLRTSDFLARISWDRFGVLAFIKSPSDALIVGEKLRTGIWKRSFIVAGVPMRFNVSIGFTVSPEDAQRPDFLFDKAERALERSKKRGKNQIDYFSKWDKYEKFPPFIDRQNIVSELIDAIENRETIILTGEEGTGKTRLLLELEEIARNLGFFVIGPYYTSIQKYPLASILGGLIKEYNETGKSLTNDLSNAFPYLFLVLKDLGAQLDQLVSPSTGRTVSRYFIVIRALVNLFGDLLKTKPVLILLDDGEEIDPDSFSLLKYLSRQYKNKNLSVVIACNDLPRDLEELSHIRVALPPFDKDEIRAFLMSMKETEIPLDEEVIFKLTKGNPSYVTLLTGTYLLTGKTPESIPDAIDKIRLSFPQFDREIIIASMVLGKVVDDSALSEVLGVSRFQVYETLEKLKKIGLMIEKGDRFMFMNRHFVQAFLKGVQKERLRSLHLQFAEYYEDRAIDSPLNKLLSAKHYRKSGKRERALSLELQAAQQLNRTIGAKSVVHIYEKPLASILTKDKYRKAKRFIPVLWDYVWLLHSQYEYKKELRALDTIETMAKALGDSDLAFDATLHKCINVLLYLERYKDCLNILENLESFRGALTGEKKADISYLKGLVALHYNRPADASKLLSSSLGEAMKLTDPYRSLRAMYALSEFYLIALDFQKSLSYSISASKLAKKIKHKPQQGFGYGIISDIYRAMGSFETALKYAHDAEKIAYETGDLRIEWKHLLRQARIFADIGQYEFSNKLITSAGSLVDLFGSPQNVLSVYIETIRLLLDQRLPKQAERLFNKISWTNPENLSVPLRKNYLMTLAKLHFWNSRPHEANKLLTPLSKLINKYQKQDMIEYYELKARIALAIGNSQNALKNIKIAVDLMPENYFTLSPKWVLYETLQTLGNIEARSVLKKMFAQLHKMASQISNKEWRLSFLEQVPQNAIILREAEQNL